MKNLFESFGGKNKKEAVFKKASREIEDKGYCFHAQEHDKNGKDPKIYHSSEHPRILKKRAERMAEILHLSPRQCAVIEMAVAWHDVIIEYDKADQNNIAAMICRYRGAREGDKPNGAKGNEGKSARLLEQEMRRANELVKEEIFTEEEIRIAILAIDATYPDVIKGATFKDYPYYEIVIRQNPDLAVLFDELKTQGITNGSLFFQPHLERPLEERQKVPREVLIVALSDLGAAGFTEKEAFFKEGDSEMRELYANLRYPEVMRRLINGDAEIDQVDRQKVTSVFLGWLDSQPGFAAWQALRFEKILHLLRRQKNIIPKEEQGLRAQFSHFIENIRYTRDRAKELRSGFQKIQSTQGEKAAFLYLVQNLHYEI